MQAAFASATARSLTGSAKALLAAYPASQFRNSRSPGSTRTFGAANFFLGTTLGFAVANSPVHAARARRNARQQRPLFTTAMADSTAHTEGPSVGRAPATGVVTLPTAPKWRLYAIEGSQFVAKVLLALDATGTPYQTFFVNVLNRSARAKQLPTSSPLVPQVEIPHVVSTPGSATEQAQYIPLAESSDILRAIDEYNTSAANKLYPSAEVRKADADISSKINAYVLYFNHVSDAGWARSIGAVITRSLPFGPLNGWLPLRFFYKPVANAQRENLLRALPNAELNDDAMTNGLISALQPYNSALNDNPATPFLFGYNHPTAADCALHAMVSRFVGTMGDANLPAALPNLFQIAGSRLEKLQKWQAHMAKLYPLQWKRYKVDQFPSGKL